MALCNTCPRKCNIDRSTSLGYCTEKDDIRVARIAPHFFEEPPISGTRGSGTVFFSGCSLKCVFCQNSDISKHGGIGRKMSIDELFCAINTLREKGVHNINLVTPTHFALQLIPLLERIKSNNDFKSIPIVYNSSGYENVNTLKALDGLIDIYMPDFKYFSSELSQKYSSASDYCEVATCALQEMLRQTGKYQYSKENEKLLQSGIIVRHLVLPSCRHDSIAVLEHIAKNISTNDILLSLMSQYTPDFAKESPFKELHRKVTSFEYTSVAEKAIELGFNGFIQERSSACAKYTPDFK